MTEPTPTTADEADEQAELYEELANNETDDEVEYHRLRAKAAMMRRLAEVLREK